MNNMATYEAERNMRAYAPELPLCLIRKRSCSADSAFLIRFSSLQGDKKRKFVFY